MPADSFESLEGRLNRLAVRGEKNAEKAVRGAGLVVDSVLVFGTPVDTGRARGGWQVSHGSPNLEEPKTLDQEGASTIARNEPVILAFKIGKDMFISNAVPYIGKLDKGSSKQAPNGFSQLAVAEGIEFVKKQSYYAGLT